MLNKNGCPKQGTGIEGDQLRVCVAALWTMNRGFYKVGHYLQSVTLGFALCANLSPSLLLYCMVFYIHI